MIRQFPRSRELLASSMNAAMSAFRSYRDDHREPLEVHFGQDPRTGRMTGLGHEATFGTLRGLVWNVTVSRHSAPSVGWPCTGNSGDAFLMASDDAFDPVVVFHDVIIPRNALARAIARTCGHICGSPGAWPTACTKAPLLRGRPCPSWLRPTQRARSPT